MRENIMIDTNIHFGGNFDDFLAEEGFLTESTATAMKKVLVWQILEAMKVQKITKKDMASKIYASQSSLNRLLNEKDTSLTLITLVSVASALGKKVHISLT